MALTFRRKARSDLREIGFYTASRWGGAQADRYLAAIRDAADRAAAKPDLGRRFEGAPAGVRYIRAGKHLVFYRTIAEDVVVLSILHERMDILSHIV